MRIALPNADDINEKNVVQAVQQVVRALETTSDMGGFHDSKAEEEIRLLRQEMRAGFEKLNEGQQEANKRLDKVEGKLEDLEGELKGTNQRLDKVEGRLENLEHSQNQMVDLLRMIADNTKPRD